MATTTDKKVILSLTINSKDAVQAIVDTTKQIENLKNAQASWKKALDAGTVSEDQYTAATAQLKAQLKDLNQTVKANEKVLLDNIKGAKAQGESLNAMRANLKTLIKEYDDFNEAQRNSAKGQELLKYISDLTLEIKDLEYQQQIFKRNVGNYMSALESTPFGKIAQQFQALSGGTMQISTAFQNATTMAKSFGAQLLKLAANPWVIAIGAVVAIVMKLVDAFKKNDDAMTALQTAFSAFQPILDLINKGFNALVGVVTNVINGFTKAATAVMSIIPSFRSASEAAQQYTKDLDALEESERQYAVESAKNEAQIASLRDKAADKEKYTAEQRIKFNKQAQALEEKNYKTQKQLAAERLRLARIEQKRDNDYSDERKNKIAELEAAYIKADADYYNAHRTLQKEQQRFEREISSEERQLEQERAQKAKEWQQKLKEMRETELSAIREYEDAIIASMDEGFEKRMKEIETQGKREIEDLKTRLKEEKNLSIKARDSINALILLKQKELNKKLVLEEATYWASTRATIAKSMSDAFNFIDTSRVETDLNKISNEFKKKIADIDASSQKMASDLDAAFRMAFDSAVHSGDKLVQYLRRFDENGNIDFSNFRKAITGLSNLLSESLGISLEEAMDRINSNETIKKLKEIYSRYLDVIGSNSRQVNQIIVDATDKSASLIQRSIMDAISNGSVTAYEHWISQHEDFAVDMANRFGSSYLDQIKGLMLNIDELLNDAYRSISNIKPDDLLGEFQISALREYIANLEEARKVILQSNEAENAALQMRQKKAQLVIDGRNTEVEQLQLTIEERQAEGERLKTQQEYLNSIRDTVKAREDELRSIRTTTANEWERLEDERVHIQHQIDSLKADSIELGIELDQNKIDELNRQIEEITSKENDLTAQVAEAANKLASTGFTSMEEFNTAQDEMTTKIMENNARIMDETKKLHNAQIDGWVSTFNTIAAAAGQLSNAFGKLFSALAEDNEEMQKYSNAMAYIDIMMSMAQGIATAVAEGMKLGWPAAAVMIPVGIATVVGGIAEAISVYKQNKNVKSAPRFSTGGPVDRSTTGGHVKGAGTGTSDSIPAMLSNGEYVIRSSVVKALGVDFFDALNGKKMKKNKFDTHFANGGLVTAPNAQTYIQTQQLDFNYAQMGDVMKEAMSEVTPVVSVREINDMQTRVNVKENIASYR